MDFQFIPTPLLDFQVALNLGETAPLTVHSCVEYNSVCAVFRLQLNVLLLCRFCFRLAFISRESRHSSSFCFAPGYFFCTCQFGAFALSPRPV